VARVGALSGRRGGEARIHDQRRREFRNRLSGPQLYSASISVGLLLHSRVEIKVASYRERAPLAGTDTSFEAYRKKYASRDPDLTNKRFADELRQLTTAEGLNELAPPPCAAAKTGNPPTGAKEAESTKYLWVVAPTSVPFALELLPDVGLQRGRLSHTNLTGGGRAHSGGEMWFTDASIIIMNGGSGRYPPRSADELDDVARAFKAVGYKVSHMGWDKETNRPVRYLRGDPQWL
jgi:hypothetical protein